MRTKAFDNLAIRMKKGQPSASDLLVELRGVLGDLESRQAELVAFAAELPEISDRLRRLSITVGKAKQGGGPIDENFRRSLH